MLIPAIVIYAVVGLVTFAVYGWDKRAAIKDRRRTPEKTLHLLALCGGIVGALAGQQIFKHKRRKAGFMVVTWGVALLHVAGWCVVLWLQMRD